MLDDGIYNQMIEDIDSRVDLGEITAQEGDKQKYAAEKSREAIQKMPEGMPSERRKRDFDLLVQKGELELDLEGKDEALKKVSPEQKKIDEINEKLSAETEERIGYNNPKNPRFDEATTEETAETKDDSGQAPSKGYRAGDLRVKAEGKGKFDGRRDTGHFGTGFYFFGDKSKATELSERDGREVSEIDTDGYNLAEGTKELHQSLKEVNNSESDVSAGDVNKIASITGVDIGRGVNPYKKYAVRSDKAYKELLASGVTEGEISEGQKKSDAWEKNNDRAGDVSASVNEKFKDPKNKDTKSTLIMKELGFDGVDSRGTDLDNAIYGSVIYDIKPTAKKKETTESKQESQVKPDVSTTEVIVISFMICASELLIALTSAAR